MRAVIFATAGHIDHGKTSLVHALTGVWCDRLKEEQERGITLVLGFAPLLAPEADLEISLVDVPGHERLVHTMVAGAGGVDRALLVVAATEGIMPQTREHLDILRLLGVEGGVVAITKADLVNPSDLEQRTQEVAAFLQETPLASAPIIPCSTVTGEGIPQVRAALIREAQGVQREGEPHRPFRLGVDRVFSLQGAGTVVTGSARWGSLTVGEEVWVSPPGRVFRVRSLHVHGREREQSFAGERVALALAGAKVEDIPRGAQVLNLGPWEPASHLALELTLLPGIPAPVENQKLWLHLLATRTVATVERITPQPTPHHPLRAWVRLATPVVAFPQDRVILRRMTPKATVGGGVVLDVGSRRLARRQYRPLEELPNPSSRAALVVFAVKSAGRTGVHLSQLVSRLGVLEGGLQSLLGKLEGEGQVVVVPGRDPLLLSPQAVRQVCEEASTLLKARKDVGIPVGEFAQALGLSEGKTVRSFFLQKLLAQGIAREQAGRLFAADFQPLSSPLALKIEELYRKAGVAAPSPQEAAKLLAAPVSAVENLTQLLVSQGRLVRVGGKWLLSRQVLEEIVESLRQWGVARFDVGQFKERFGLTRKLAIPILEWLDSQRITRREGDLRRVLPTSEGRSSSG